MICSLNQRSNESMMRFSRLILNQRSHVVTSELLTSRQKFQFHYEYQSLDLASQSFHQIANGSRGAARREQVVRDDHAMAIADRVTMNLQSVLTVLKIIRNRSALGRQLLRLAHRHKSGAQVIGQRRRENETAGFDAYNRIDLRALVLSGKRIYGLAQAFRMFQ